MNDSADEVAGSKWCEAFMRLRGSSPPIMIEFHAFDATTSHQGAVSIFHPSVLASTS